MLVANELEIPMVDECGFEYTEYRYIGVAKVKSSVQQFHELMDGGYTEFDHYLDSDTHRADIEEEKWGWLKKE